jgi:tetratricopeptide (TPR) repeat protein
LDSLSPIEQRLVNDLRERRIIPFVGSGLSAQSGLPDAKRLAEMMWKELHPGKRLPRKPVSLFLTAHEYRGKFSAGYSWRFLQDLFRRSTQASAAHTALARFPSELFITTNYDKLLETALQDVYGNPPYTVLDASDLLALNRWGHRERSTVVKLHGDIDSYESIILTQQDYIDFLERKGDLIEALAYIVAKQPFLFIGYSLVDPDIHKIFERANEIAKGMTQSYILVPWKPDRNLQATLKKFNISSIEYGSYNALSAYLHKLADYSHSSMIPESPSLFPPSRRNNLPERGALFGRGEDIHTITQLYDSTQISPKPIVITGPKGIGKSSVSIEVARQLIDEQRIDFAAFLDFRGWPNALSQGRNSLLQGLLKALGFHIPDTNDQSFLISILNIFKRSKGIIILDNFEDRNSRDAIEFAKNTGLQRIQVIITSTDLPLEKEEAETFLLKPLNNTAMRQIADEWALRTMQSLPQNVAQIINETQGNPALLLWALTLAETKGVKIAVEALKLEKEKRDGQFAVRFLEFLPETYANTVLSLALLPAPVSVGLVQNVSGISLEDLKWMEDRKILIDWDVQGGRRLRVHSLFAAIDNSHYSYRALKPLKKKLIQAFYKMCDSSGWRKFDQYPILDRELENIVKSIEWAREINPRKAIHMLLALDDFLYIRGQYQIRYKLGMLLLPIARKYNLLKEEGELLLNPIGESLWHLEGGPKAALEEFRQARNVFRQAKSEVGEGWSLYYSGRVLRSIREFKKAQKHLQDALKFSKSDKRLHGLVLNNLGNLWRNQGRKEEAEKLYLQSLKIWEKMQDKEMLAVTKRNLGFLAQQRNNLDLAETLFKEALEYHEELSQPVEIGEIHQALGELAIKKKDVSLAKHHLLEARQKFLSTGTLLKLVQLQETLSRLS